MAFRTGQAFTAYYGRYEPGINRMIPANLYRGIPAPLVANTHVRIERIVSWKHATAPDTWYDQEWPEWVVLLRGQADLRIENGATQTLNPGDHVLIPAHCRHRVEWTSSNPPAIWLAIHFREA